MPTLLQAFERIRTFLTPSCHVFSQCTSLRVLSLSDNEIFTLPEAFGNMQNLVDMDVSNNRLRSLPESLSACTSLTRLMIQKNNLTSISQDLHTLTLLRFLRLGGNPWEFLPSQLGSSPHLIEVNADGLQALATTRQEVLNFSVPPRNPLQVLLLAAFCHFVLTACV